MTTKTILVPLRGDAIDARALTVAGTLARRFGSHIVGLHVEPDPDDLITTMPIDVGGGAYFVEELTKSLRDHSTALRNAVKTHFSEWRAAAGIPETVAPGEASGESAELVLKLGNEQAEIRDHALAADLVILGLPERGNMDDDHALEIALLDAGRPVLALPQDVAVPAADAPVAIAWNGSAESAHALAFALPFIRDAKSVIVLHADLPKTGTAIENIVSYLAWHGIRARIEELGDADTPGVLIAERAEELGVGTLVMGAYTHSRARELVFGGVTRYMLHSAKVPLFLAH
jgi:nucleotide-binding universal stress UspA family protein